MKLDRFINRPVLSTVISIVIVILGVLGLLSLPISQYPDIAPPTVRVNTTYQGANAQTVLNSVIAPLEEQINGVENMMYMTSTATNTGEASIEVYFKQGTDPDMAAVNVQNRVAKAQGLLPAEVTKVGVITSKRQTSMLLRSVLAGAKIRQRFPLFQIFQPLFYQLFQSILVFNAFRGTFHGPGACLEPGGNDSTTRQQGDKDVSRTLPNVLDTSLMRP